MPHEWNGKLVVTKDELIPDFFTNEHCLSKTLVRYKKKNYGIKKVWGGGNGRILLIDFDSLDVEIRKALGDPRKVYKNNWLDRFYVKDAEALQFYTSYRFADGGGLSEEHIEDYTLNASVLKACQLLRVARERERRTKAGSVLGIMKTIWSDAIHFQQILEEKYGCRHSLPNNERRFCDAYKKFEKEGYQGLISKKHGIKNALKVTEELISLLIDLFAGVATKPTATQVTRQYTAFLAGQIEVVNNATGEVYEPAEFPAISDSTIQAYLAKWETRIGTFKKRSGNRQTYMNQFKATHTLDRPNFSGSLLSIDDRNPPFVMENGKRVWFYNAIDLCSEAWTCWVHGRTKEGIILEFYRQLVRNYHKWGIGMSYELECEASLNSSYRNSFLADGQMFERVRIEANNATGKKIERYFRELRYGAEKEMDGWQARPFARSEANQTKTDKKVTLPYDTIVAQTIKAMEDWNSAEHPIYKGKTRWEVFLERQNEKTVPIRWEQILPKLGYEVKTSCNTGFVRLNKQKMCLGLDGKLATGDTLISLMKKVEGKDLFAYFLDDDDGQIIKAMAYLDGKYVCDLVGKPTYNRAWIERTEQCHINYALMSAYSNTIEAFGTRQSKAIEKVTILDNRKAFVMEREVEVLPAVNMDDDFDSISYETADEDFLNRF